MMYYTFPIIGHLGYCDDPVAPSNGGKIYSGNLEGDTVTYFCNKHVEAILAELISGNVTLNQTAVLEQC